MLRNERTMTGSGIKDLSYISKSVPKPSFLRWKIQFEIIPALTLIWGILAIWVVCLDSLTKKW